MPTTGLCPKPDKSPYSIACGFVRQIYNLVSTMCTHFVSIDNRAETVAQSPPIFRLLITGRPHPLILVSHIALMFCCVCCCCPCCLALSRGATRCCLLDQPTHSQPAQPAYPAPDNDISQIIRTLYTAGYTELALPSGAHCRRRFRIGGNGPKIMIIADSPKHHPLPLLPALRPHSVAGRHSTAEPDGCF